MKVACALNKSIRSDEGVNHHLPLAMFAVERNSKTRLLFDVSTRKIRGVSSYIFPDATCAFESRGWLLMIRHKPLHFQDQEQSVFLVHPSSGKQLNNLPVFPCRDLEQQGHDKGLFVFYVGSHGLPLVVARFEIQSIVPTVHIACPGDTYWSVYKHGAEPELEPPHMLTTLRRLFESTWVADLALLGEQVICVDVSRQILVFDITELTWGRRRRMAPPPLKWSQENHHLYLVASQSHGEVVLVSRSRHGTMESGFEFFMLDMEAMEWSRMDDRELDDTSWFLCTGGQSFRVKDAGRKRVYTFGGPKPMDSSCEQTTDGMAMGSSTSCFTRTSTSSGHDDWLKSITNVYAYDLDDGDGTVEMVIPASIVTEVRQWVQPSIFATTAK